MGDVRDGVTEVQLDPPDQDRLDGTANPLEEANTGRRTLLEREADFAHCVRIGDDGGMVTDATGIHSHIPRARSFGQSRAHR